MGANKFVFRSWFYFRNGWSLYLAFIFAAVNALTVTYFLAIEKYPLLQTIFPSFPVYVVIVAGLGIPILILIGYVHHKKSEAFKSEADIYLEVNRYHARQVVNGELSLKLEKIILDLLLKMNVTDSISNEHKQNIEDFLKEYEELTKTRTLDNIVDSTYFHELESRKSNLK